MVGRPPASRVRPYEARMLRMKSLTVFLVLLAAACASTRDPLAEQRAAWEMADQDALHSEVHAAAQRGDRVTTEAAGTIYLRRDRKSTRLNSSHGYISYAVFCLKKKNKQHI